MTPNDPKLSDGGGWRGPCMAGGKAAAEARAVTAVAVRCSAWLGDVGKLDVGDLGFGICLVPGFGSSDIISRVAVHVEFQPHDE